MKKSYFTNKLISAMFITIVLLYFMLKTTSPKIIFVPFLICSVSMAGKNTALLLDKKRLVDIFQKLFVIGFLLFWFGFLAVVSYVCVIDKKYWMMIFSIPFWVAGIYVVRNKLLKVKSKNGSESKVNFGIIISAGLVITALLAGVIILILGLKEWNAGLIFTGAFFTFGALTFVLVALMAQGFFDKFKIDVFGMYVGVLFVVLGCGFILLEYGETYSLLETVRAFGLWILIPILLIVVGAFQIVKCLRNRK